MNAQENKVAAAVSKAGTFEDKAKTKVRRERVVTWAEKVAGHPLVKINHYHELFRAKFPGNPKMWSVDKCYPLANGGPLWIDEPRLDYRIEECRRKLAEVKEFNKTAKVKMRYLVLKNGVEPIGQTEGIEI